MIMLIEGSTVRNVVGWTPWHLPTLPTLNGLDFLNLLKSLQYKTEEGIREKFLILDCSHLILLTSYNDGSDHNLHWHSVGGLVKYKKLYTKQEEIVTLFAT